MPPNTNPSASVPVPAPNNSGAIRPANGATVAAKAVPQVPFFALGGAITATGLITASGVLLAFLVGFYTLIARERKSPYLINSAVWILLVCMSAALAGSVSMIVGNPVGTIFLYGGCVLLLVAIALAVWRVYRLAIRLAYFVDTANPKHFSFVRRLKQIYRSLTKKKRYEHNSVDFTDRDVAEIVGALTPLDFEDGNGDKRKSIQASEEKSVRSIAMRFDHHGKANDNLAKLVLICLSKGYLVQYLTASRHPIDFIEYLKRQYEAGENQGQWAAVANQIIVIDAYTPHFGFTDSVYQIATEDVDSLGVGYLTSTETYAGLHTAASRAFNQNKKKQNSDVRKPALIIYEDCYALSDLESVEQYRIFLRHVIPSERLWDGMFTVFIETFQADNDWSLLKSYVDAVFDLRK